MRYSVFKKIIVVALVLQALITPTLNLVHAQEPPVQGSSQEETRLTRELANLQRELIKAKANLRAATTSSDKRRWENEVAIIDDNIAILEAQLLKLREDESLGGVVSKENRGLLGAAKEVFIGGEVEGVVQEKLNAWVIAPLSNLLFYITGGLLWAAAQLFELSASYTVEHFKDIIDSPGVTLAWTTLRDFANIFFIFILLYVAIGYILDLDIGSKDKIIAKVITIAILINFSAFFARAIIDVSNIAAYQFYAGVKTLGQSTVVDQKTYTGIAGVFMNKLDLQAWFTDVQTDILKSLAFGFARAALMIVTAFIFLAAALLLITRMVWLIFLVVLSPLAFLAYAVPKLGGRFSDWWSRLINQAFFAPIYFLFVYLSVSVMMELPLDTLLNGGGGKIPLLVNFTIIIGLMVASLMAAVTFGATGAKYVSGLGKKWRERAVGGITGAIGRNTIGKLAYIAKDSKILESLKARVPTVGTALGNLAATGAKAKFGSTEGYEQKLDRFAKEAEKIKDPVKRAQYLKNLGRSVLLGGVGDRLIKEKAFEKLKDEDKVKTETGLKKPYEESLKAKTKAQLETEKENYQRETGGATELDWLEKIYPNLKPEDKATSGIAQRAQKAGEIKLKMEEFDRKIATAPETEAELKQRQGRAYAQYEKLGGVVSKIARGMSPEKIKKLEEARQKEASKEKNKKRKEEELKSLNEELATKEEEIGQAEKDLREANNQGWVGPMIKDREDRVKNLKRERSGMIDRVSRLENALGYNREESGGKGGEDKGGEGGDKK